MSRRQKTKERTLAKELGALLSKVLMPDLRARAKMPSVAEALRHRFEHEQADERTAESYEVWVEHLVEQVGAAWILSCVFVRTLEDRDLVPRRRLAGDGAADSEHYFNELAPSLDARDYLLTVFRELSRFPSTEALLGPKGNPVWRLAPSGSAAQTLLDFFRERKDDGSLRWTFGTAAGVSDGRSDGSSTRFLGDLYQDLSESVRERYALLQTPDFVERFILGLTLDPAIQEYGLEKVRLIDPTCGSGHFLLGAYDRLFEARLAAKPGLDRREHALEALKQVYGVDVNPYAVAIARFRLTLAFLEKAGLSRISEVPRLPHNLVVADSLLYAVRGITRDLVEVAEDKRNWGDSLFTLEDPDRAVEVLALGYHAVVGNPPYITCKDARLRGKYRKLYPGSAAGKFALAAPFTERFFQLAGPGGFVGLINANSFMKREFGRRLIETVLKRLDLTHVIDTSGAFIPGHGTPTIILIGRNRSPVGSRVRAALGRRGEPTTPEDAETGEVWSSIAGRLFEVGFENEYITIADVDRNEFDSHPWSIGGGGAAELKGLLEARSKRSLGEIVDSVGIASVTGEDDVYLLPAKAAERLKIERTRPMVVGEAIRDWSLSSDLVTIFPYNDGFGLIRIDDLPLIRRVLWAAKPVISHRRRFGVPMLRRGLSWYELQELYAEKLRNPLTIAFAFVSTHNHFVLDRGGKVFKQSAPIIKLREGATEEDHLALLGYLNSSTMAFWGRQNFSSKGAQGVNEGIKAEAWEQFLEYAGTPLAKLPCPDLGGLSMAARTISDLAEHRERLMPAQCLAGWRPGSIPLEVALKSAQEQADRNLARMCAVQEELDWLVYVAFGLLTPEDRDLLDGVRGEVWPNFPASIEWSPGAIERSGLYPGHRAFEVVLARDCLASGTLTAWFERNGYRSPSEITQTYSPASQRLIAERVAIIDRNPHIRILEKPEFKRRWTLRSFADEAKAAARGWLLDRAEQILTRGVSVHTARDVETHLLRAPGAAEVAGWLFGESDPGGLRELLLGEAVPNVAVARFTQVGIDKHSIWQRTWDSQRLEDAGQDVGDISVPPKYDQKDYRDPIYWRLRGKLDVPKERFISYPGAERDDDKSPLIGWAGWDHLQRAQALAALYQERKTQDAWEKERLQPLLAGLLELVPWLKQWHNAPDEDPAKDRAGDAYATFVEAEARSLGFTLGDLPTWRPPVPTTKGSSKVSSGSASAKKKAASTASAFPADAAAQSELPDVLMASGPNNPESPAPPPKPRRKKKSKEAAE